MMSCQRESDHLDRFCGKVNDNEGGGGGELGPCTGTTGGGSEVSGNMYLEFLSSSSRGNSSSDKLEIDADIPFTYAQRKELERQAMIYKYMLASVPVPADLLHPFSISRNFSDSSTPVVLNVRYQRNGDPEPGRCKRTDGKKWRCSKEVATLQKYCERHLQRSRPRSRKPVEDTNKGEIHKKTRLQQKPTLPRVQDNCGSSTPQQFTTTYMPHILFDTDTGRDLSRLTKGETVGLDGAKQHLVESQKGLTNESSSIYGFGQDIIEQQFWNSLPHLNYSASGTGAPSAFFDTWSNEHLGCGS